VHQETTGGLASGNVSQSLGEGLLQGLHPQPCPSEPPPLPPLHGPSLADYMQQQPVCAGLLWHAKAKQAPAHQKASLGCAEGRGPAASTPLFHCGRSVSLPDREVTLDVLVSSLSPSPSGAGREPCGRSTQAISWLLLFHLLLLLNGKSPPGWLEPRQRAARGAGRSYHDLPSLRGLGGW